MIQTIVDGRKFYIATGEQENTVRAIITSTAFGIVKHGQICRELRIGQFMPATHYAPYALRGVGINIYDDKVLFYCCEAWYECYKCHHYINITLVTNACKNCGATRIPNFKK